VTAEKLAAVPILRKLRFKDWKDGKDVKLVNETEAPVDLQDEVVLMEDTEERRSKVRALRKNVNRRRNRRRSGDAEHRKGGGGDGEEGKENLRRGDDDDRHVNGDSKGGEGGRRPRGEGGARGGRGRRGGGGRGGGRRPRNSEHDHDTGVSDGDEVTT